MNKPHPSLESRKQVMGRITPSFRKKFHEKIWELRKKLRDTFLDDEMKVA
jgi:hypothetical protein